jgi:hypothetical protein
MQWTAPPKGRPWRQSGNQNDPEAALPLSDAHDRVGNEALRFDSHDVFGDTDDRRRR